MEQRPQLPFIIEPMALLGQLMVTTNKLNIFTLIFTAIGAVAPIAWEMWSRPHALALVVVGRTLLIQNTGKVDGLKIKLGDREISQLFSTEISIENAGWKVIEKGDIIKPMVATFHDAPILGLALKDRYPGTLEYSTKLLNPTSLEVEFDILNRGERVILNVLTENEPEEVHASIRAKNFSNVTVLDYLKRPPLFARIPNGTLPTLLFSLLFIVFSIRFGRKELAPLRQDAYWIGKNLEIGFNKGGLRELLERNIWPRLTNEQQLRLTVEIEHTNPNDEHETKKLANLIAIEALRRDPSGIVAIGILLALCISLYSSVQLFLAFVA